MSGVLGYAAELIWAVLKAKAAGAGHRVIAVAVGIPTPVRTSPRPGSPKSYCAIYFRVLSVGGLRYEIHTALESFYQFCAACKVPQVIRFARTIETWQAPIIAALQTGLTNARTEGYNRIVKHVGRIAFGFRNADNQRRRVRWACTRQSRRITPSRHQCHC